MTFAREPLQVVEILQPKCSRTFGVGLCTGSGLPCWNTDATCQVPTALDLTEFISLKFVKPISNRYLGGEKPFSGFLLTEANGELLTETDDEIELQGFETSAPYEAFQPMLAIPALLAVQTAPTVLNVAAGNNNLSPLGLRSVAEVVIEDFPYNDLEVDPYLSARPYDPLQFGSFWTKWLARNPFHVGLILRVYDGFMGQRLNEMICREYSIEKIDASKSSVKITAKDILRRVTDNDLKAPALSPGSLAAAILAGATSLTVAGAVLDDYPASGRIKINNEIIFYTGRSLSGSNINFTGLTRGVDGTVAAAHAQFDRVQRVLLYQNQPFQNIIFDLLTVWGGIPTRYIDKAAWDAEKLEWRDLYNFTAIVSEPVSIQQLVGELCQQSQSNIWWDERVQKIILRAQRPNTVQTALTQEDNLIADSVTVEEVSRERVSRVYVYYGLRNPTLNPTDKFSYRSAEVLIDVDKERQYGEPAVKEIFCRWISTSVLARSLGDSYLRRFRDVRRNIRFMLTADDITNLWTGDVTRIRHFLLVGPDGREREGQWLITSAETVDQGFLYSFIAEDNDTAGNDWRWVDAAESRPKTETGCWVDANGRDELGNLIPYSWL